MRPQGCQGFFPVPGKVVELVLLFVHSVEGELIHDCTVSISTPPKGDSSQYEKFLETLKSKQIIHYLKFVTAKKGYNYNILRVNKLPAGCLLLEASLEKEFHL